MIDSTSAPLFIQKCFDAWKGADEDKILAYYSDDVVIHLPTGTSKTVIGMTALHPRMRRPLVVCTHNPRTACGHPRQSRLMTILAAIQQLAGTHALDMFDHRKRGARFRQI